MNDRVGKALWEIYEEAVKDMPQEAKGGVAGATLKFIKAFEQETAQSRLDLYSKSALGLQHEKEAKIR